MSGDEDLLRRLDAIFAANDPADDIDRCDGFGSTVWVESLLPVDDGPYGEWKVTFGLAVLDRFEFRELAPRGSVRVPFGREWLEASGNADPVRFAPRDRPRGRLSPRQRGGHHATR